LKHRAVFQLPNVKNQTVVSKIINSSSRFTMKPFLELTKNQQDHQPKNLHPKRQAYPSTANAL